MTASTSLPIAALVPHFATISIQTNSHCNLRCRFCFYGQIPEYDTPEILETRVIEKTFRELAAMDYRGRVSLYNMNDPLTEERLLDLLARARSLLPGCYHFLSTNGLLLTQNKLDHILEFVDCLRINNYGRIPELDLSSPKIDLRDKRGFLQLATSNRGGSLTNLPAVIKPGEKPCANPFGQVVVMPPGVVVLCCSDGLKQVILGDVRHQTLPEIWYGPEFQRVRMLHATGRRQEAELCNRCSVEEGSFIEFFEEPERFRNIIREVGAQV